ncbi:heterokaryon incompatibility protein-domain-containing protein [Ustulina deusta]|nr:heterokaryon incompatibility protein-domain-containing protein [Ustulina deusta]
MDRIYSRSIHCWGKLSEVERFCAFNRNISQLKESVDFNAVPKTFRDLWIDSLCILQDNKNDWEYESTRMEQVFSSAYCTIAASSSKSSVEGFLNYREPRPCVKVETGKRTLYVCPNIDDLYRDVDLGELNSRGWVLQERALSRRTIFYTSTQVYWECGAGVRCETLAKLQNSKAAFLGDAKFPDSALEYYRDGRQMLVQDLYERYSGLAFTTDWDRPIAILGLQERLARAFKTQAAFGFFSTYFARLLLWKCRNRLMTCITQQPGSSCRVPTWSWFSKVGAIQYLDLKFEQIDWAVTDFSNPFKRSVSSSPDEEKSMLRGCARKLIMTEFDMLVSVTFDESQDFEVGKLRCVLVGCDRRENAAGRMRYHVLIIHEISGPSGEGVYERVGVASLKPTHVAGEGVWVDIR